MEKTEHKYGELPVKISKIKAEGDEMLFWLYCPIKMHKFGYLTEIPDNLKQFADLIDEAYEDFKKSFGLLRFRDSYVYVTAKRMYVSKENTGQRPGWHSDGFLTDDINYIWSDSNPTLFWDGTNYPFRAHFTKDHDIALEEMNFICENYGERFVGEENMLYRLDETVLHRVNQEEFVPGVRTFVKISFSDKEYALKGNSINHKFGPFENYRDRLETRNCPRG